MTRYIRAFFTALKMTLRGETAPPPPYAPLRAWINEASQRVQAVFAAADAAGLDHGRRQKLMLKLDGRATSLQTVLATVAYHVDTEYPHLLRDLDQHSVTAIYAGNLNDQYAVARLCELEAVQDSGLAAALQRLRDHLTAIPPSTSL